MADPPPYPNPGEGAGTPRWVKVFGIIAFIVFLLLVILLLTRGPDGHGPGRHLPSGGTIGDTLPSSVVTESHTTPGDAPDGYTPPYGDRG